MTADGVCHLELGIPYVLPVAPCHAVNKELDCAQNIFSLLVAGGMCVVIDMNYRFPFFRSDLTNRFRRRKEKQCYVHSL